MAKVLVPIVLAIVFAAVAVQGAAVPDELKKMATAARAECMAETGVTEDAIEKTGTGEFADDEKLKCYFRCIYDKFLLIKDDEINFDAMLAYVPEPGKEKATKTIDACRETTGKDLCDKTFNISKCFYEQDPEGYFAI